MIKKNSIITASSYTSMLFLGVATALIGAAARNIGLSPFQIGLMITFQNLGFMLSVMVSGALADTHEKSKILLIGSLILSVSFLSFYLTQIFNVNLFIMFSIGIGIGTYEGVTDALLLDLHTDTASLHISVNHFFVTFGAILITVYLLFLQMDWRNAVVQSGVFVFILATIFAFTKLNAKKKASETYLTKLRLLTKDKIVVTFFIATALVVGVEAGTIGILTTYLMDMREFTQITSKIGLIIFLSGIAIGRLILGYFTPQDKILTFLLALFGSSVVFYSLLYFVDLSQLTYGAIFMAGLTLSAILPLLLTQAGLLYEEMSGTVLGVIKVAIPIGGILLPFLMSLLVSYINFSISLIVFPLSFLLILILFYAVFFTGRNPIESSSTD